MQHMPFQHIANLFFADPNRSGVHLFKMIDAAQKRGFAGPGGSENHHHFAGPDIQIDSFQDLIVAIILVHVTGTDQGFTLTHCSSR